MNFEILCKHGIEILALMGLRLKKKNTLKTYLKWNPLIQHVLCSVFANALVGHTLETIKQVFFEFRS